MDHEHNIVDHDTHFKIDPISRKIEPTVPDKVELIQRDHNSERFTFELPRYIEGHDMSLCTNVQVHYNNIRKDRKAESRDVYESTDLAVVEATETEEEKIQFSWLVSKNATQYIGKLAFIIRMACIDEENEIVYDWHSAMYTAIRIGEGINNEEIPEEKYADILEAWKQEIVGNLEWTINRMIEEGKITIPNGKSAYEIAVKNGFEGTEEEWLESLKGEAGTTDHRQLGHREDADQHTIDSITGLREVLNSKGTYSKPDEGIPASDMSESVRESLEKADSALQEHQSLEGYASEDYVDNEINDLQGQIDAVISRSDVIDVVDTYAELQAYDTSDVGDKDVIKVLQDSTHENARSYYRWSYPLASTWNYVGSEGVGYTKAEADTLLNDKVDKVSGKGLSTNDYTDEDKAKVSSAITEKEIFEAIYGQTTFNEVQDALSRGKKVQVKRVEANGTYIYDLTLATDTDIRFGQATSANLLYCTLKKTNSWSYGSLSYSTIARITDIPSDDHINELIDTKLGTVVDDINNI